MNSPVLLIVFNRPDTTRKVFDAIKLFKPPILYVSADAPRKGNMDDNKKCAEVREIVKEVDWECDAKYRFLEENLGCGYGPSSAISWVLEDHDRVIILEDDCVPAQPFFGYCDYLLEKYKDDERIWIISGRSHHPEFPLFKKYDYIFTRYGHSWGWATWKRCWDQFDIDMSDLALFIEEDGFSAVFPDEEQAEFYRKKYEILLNDDNLNSHIWDYQAGFTVIKNCGLSIVPSQNLIHNVGSIGTHSTRQLKVHEIPKYESYKLVNEPQFVTPNAQYELFHFRNHINPPSSDKRAVLRIPRRALRKLVKLLTEGS